MKSNNFEFLIIKKINPNSSKNAFNIFCVTFMNFSAPERDPRRRTISVAYIAIQSSDKLTIKAGSDAKNVSWFEVRKIPKNLAFDHNIIIKEAINALAKLVLDDPRLILPFLNGYFSEV